MPGLFDALKRGAIDIFSGGPPVQGVGPGVGSREGLITAGLSTIAAPTEDPLEALALGALAGRQAGAQAREQRKLEMSRAGLAAFVQEAGFDREGLTRALVRALGAGDFETAIPLSEIIKAFPREQNRTSPLLAPTEAVDPETGEQVFVSFNKETGAFERVPGFQPLPDEAGFKDAKIVKDENSSTGWSYRGFDRRLGVERIITGAPPPGGSGGGQGTAQQAATRIRAESVLQDVPAAFDDPGLRSLVAGSLAEMASKGGFVTSAVGNWALNKFAPETQAANAARDRVAAMVQNIMSGATMAESERQYYRRAYTPARGDTDQTNEQKRASVIFMMERLAELGLDPETTNFEELSDEQKAQIATMVREAGSAAGVPAFDPFAGVGNNDGN